MFTLNLGLSDHLYSTVLVENESEVIQAPHSESLDDVWVVFQLQKEVFLLHYYGKKIDQVNKLTLFISGQTLPK